MTKARTAADKIRAKRTQAALRAALPELAPVARKQGNGRTYRNPIQRNPQAEMLKARCRRWSIPSSKWRDMRDPWWGCEAGGAMALAVPDRHDRLVLWDAICHMRRVITAFDRVIGAPSRHAQCLRLLLPLDELSADASSPPLDERTDEERQDAAVRDLQWLEEWMGRAGEAAQLEACRVVWDDQPARNVEAMLRALWNISDGICGHLKRSS